MAGFAGFNRVVVQAKYLGDSATDDVVLIHEVGHALGLAHTWKGGCQNNDCLADGDKVCDTPPDNRTLEGCEYSSNSCSSDSDDPSTHNPYRSQALGGLGDQPDDYTNYMDYNRFRCMTHFTQGQADRMHFFAHERYASLLESAVCLPPCELAVSASFVLPDSIAVGSTLTVENTSTDASSYHWSVGGIPVSTDRDLTYTFATEGVTTVQLTAYTDDSLCVADHLQQQVSVYCPVEACLDYQISEQYLTYESCTELGISQVWVVLDGDGDTLHTSTMAVDSVYINNIDFIQLCLSAAGEHCSASVCDFITIASDGSEICNNGEDDDGDGLIDLFDPDCPCAEDAYQAQCPTDCEILPNNFPDIKMKLKWESEIIGNSTSNIVLGDVINNKKVSILTTKTVPIDLFTEEVFLINVNGRDGSTNFETRINEDQRGHLAIGNISFDSTDVFYGLLSDFNNYSSSLILEMNSDDVSNPNNSSINLADLNGDGNVELIKGTSIYNSKNGKLLIDGPLEGGCNFGSPCVTSVVAVGDLTESSGLELAAGNTVFEIEITNLDGLSGNTATIINAEISIFDGFTSIGDINGDGKLDVISVRSNTYADGGGVFVWNPRSTELIAKGNAGQSGGVAFLGDIDNDCSPEIGVAFKNELRLYKYDGSKDLQLVWQIPTSDNSGRTGGTMFDFNQDGKLEVIYRDETHLKIIEGISGFVLDSIMIGSITGRENPIIADVDNDGEAEILIAGTESIEEESRLFCFESATSPWAPARSVWNQYAYNPTQVNDDLTIPRYQQNAAQPLQGTENCPRETCNTPYNNFMVQATMRTQEGCYVWPSEDQDLTITASARCVLDSLEICLYVGGADSLLLSQGVEVACYFPPWEPTTDTIMDRMTLMMDTTCFMVEQPANFDSIMIVVNDRGFMYPPDLPNTGIQECDYTNNEYVLQLGGPDFSIDILDYECSGDSLVFSIAIDNTGSDLQFTADTVRCIPLGCYFGAPFSSPVFPGLSTGTAELFPVCLSYDTTTMMYVYQDTIQITIPLPEGESAIWWAINDGGSGPSPLGSLIDSTIAECNYSNNIDSITFDISVKTLDLGPDITKCSTEVVTLTAGPHDFVSYEWTDLSTDSTYSTTAAGQHYVEAVDQCGRVCRDTMIITIEEPTGTLPDDYAVCIGDSTIVAASGTYDSVRWLLPADVVCGDCDSIFISVDTLVEVVVQTFAANCVHYDSLLITPIIPIQDTTAVSICAGSDYNWYGTVVDTAGTYMHQAVTCDTTYTLQLTVLPADTSYIDQQLCEGDTTEIDGALYWSADIITVQDTTIAGCDSLTVIDLMLVEQLHDTLYTSICAGDSIEIHGAWQQEADVYSAGFLTENGCDSTHTVVLALDSVYQTSQTAAICSADSFLFAGIYVTTAATYYDTLQSIAGCDSIIALDLSVTATYSDSVSYQLCIGDTLELDDITVIGDTVITLSHQSVAGCDSMVWYEVVFVDVAVVTLEVSLCDGEFIELGGLTISQDTMWTDTIAAADCDTIYQYAVSVLPRGPDVPLPQDTIVEQGADVVINWYESDDWRAVALQDADGTDLPLGDPLVVFDVSEQLTLQLIYESTAASSIENVPCEYVHEFTISVENDVSLVIPNIFSPNGDGVNELWQIDLSDYTDVVVSIYDRWGARVGAWHGESAIVWDGTYQGRGLTQGVYIAVITYTDMDGQSQLVAQDITLVR